MAQRLAKEADMSMTDAGVAKPKTSDQAGAAASKSVAIIGGGISGITAAVKLFRQGYKVTLFEREAVLGGNLSSNSKNDLYFSQKRSRKLPSVECFSDVYPHIFGDWYKEFWYFLEEDLGISREEIFVPRAPIKMAMIPSDTGGIKSFSDVNFASLRTPTSLTNLIGNLDSGILSKRDMFMFGYTYLDLAAVPKEYKPSKVLNELDVTGYLCSRPYMNNNIAKFHDDILKVIWSMPSDQTSAQAYRNLIRHTITFPNEIPFAWFIGGPIKTQLMDKITDRLDYTFAQAGTASELKLSTEVTAVEIVEETPGGTAGVRLHFRKAGINGSDSSKKFDYAVVATQSKEALKLAVSEPYDRSMIKYASSLTGLRQTEVGRIPVVYLKLNDSFVRRMGGNLSNLPRELIGFKKAPPPCKTK